MRPLSMAVALGFLQLTATVPRAGALMESKLVPHASSGGDRNVS
jgi:hypothetical protein